MAMHRTIWRWLKRRPPIGIAVSVAFHLLLIVSLIGVRPPSKVYTVDRGEPLIVELPKADEQAQRGQEAAPAAPKPPQQAPKTAPAARVQPPAPKAPPPAPAPRVARVEPPVAPKAAEIPASEPPKVSPPPTPAPQDAPPPDRAQSAVEPPKPVESPANEPPNAEADARQPQPKSPAPQVAAAPAPRDPVVDTRSALRRRPGAPGAGGFGEGRAGIEGEAIALNSTDKRFADYLIRVKRMIQDKWTYPCVREAGTGECLHKSAQLIVEFGILKNGDVPYVYVHQPAAWDVYDSAAVNAIKLASPFPPVPASLMATVRPGSSGVPIIANFHYVLDRYSITNFLR